MILGALDLNTSGETGLLIVIPLCLLVIAAAIVAGGYLAGRK